MNWFWYEKKLLLVTKNLMDPTQAKHRATAAGYRALLIGYAAVGCCVLLLHGFQSCDEKRQENEIDGI